MNKYRKYIENFLLSLLIVSLVIVGSSTWMADVMPQALVVFNRVMPPPPLLDQLPDNPTWQISVQYQAVTSHGKPYQGCLLGDSISSGLGNSLGADRANFAIGGMSSVSLIPQLKALVAKQVQCQTTIVAIGTNDAWYNIQDEAFEQNMNQVVELVRSLTTKQIYLLPAFYSTLAASQNPKMAGTLQRVDEINQILTRVATAQKIPLESALLTPLFEQTAPGQHLTLQQSLTGDGVHLNTAGKAIYREVILKLFAD